MKKLFILIALLLPFLGNAQSVTLIPERIDSINVAIQNAQRDKTDTLARPFLFKFDTTSGITYEVFEWPNTTLSAVDTNGDLYFITIYVNLGNNIVDALGVSDWRTSNAARRLMYMKYDGQQYYDATIPTDLRDRLILTR